MCFRHTCFQYACPRVIVHGLMWTGNGVMVIMRTYSKWLAIVYSMLYDAEGAGPEHLVDAEALPHQLVGDEPCFIHLAHLHAQEYATL